MQTTNGYSLWNFQPNLFIPPGIFVTPEGTNEMKVLKLRLTIALLAGPMKLKALLKQL